MSVTASSAGGAPMCGKRGVVLATTAPDGHASRPRPATRSRRDPSKAVREIRHSTHHAARSTALPPSRRVTRVGVLLLGCRKEAAAVV